MRFDCSANAGRKPSPSVRLMMAGTGSLESGRTRSASVTPSPAGISRVSWIMLGAGWFNRKYAAKDRRRLGWATQIDCHLTATYDYRPGAFGGSALGYVRAVRARCLWT